MGIMSRIGCSALTIIPVGANRNEKPIAKATWGKASRGERVSSTFCQKVERQHACRMKNVSMHAKNVLTNVVKTVREIDSHTPLQANTALKPFIDGWV